MSPLRTNIRAKAFAKINLTLRVLGVRADGYHELRTTFQAIDLHDTLTFAPARQFSIECDDPVCPRDRTNLVWKAAEELWKAGGRAGVMPGARVTIVKRIPARAGLGGGSSDAAAALRALSALWKVKKAPMREIAGKVGADVAFFLEGGTSLGLERGELLFPLADWPPSWVVAALPDFGVSTKDAYRWFDETRRTGPVRPGAEPDRPTRRPSPQPLAASPWPEMWNDLEAPVAARHPEIAEAVASLRRTGAVYAAMSGSGSSVFGLYGSRSKAERAAKRLAGPRLRTILARTLSRNAYGRGSRTT